MEVTLADLVAALENNQEDENYAMNEDGKEEVLGNLPLALCVQ